MYVCMYESVAPTLLCRTINFVVQGRIKEGEWVLKERLKFWRVEGWVKIIHRRNQFDNEPSSLYAHIYPCLKVLRQNTNTSKE